MKKLLFYLFILCSTSAAAQNGTTFEVEQLSKPEKLHPVASPDEIYRYLMLSDNELTIRITEKDIWKPPFNVIAKSESPDSLVHFGYNSFFRGMYQAYADHRPFVLSPDMIWLLISQGFAQHVNANHESLRKYFVDFSGKQSLVVQSNKKLEDPSLSWEEMLPQFTEQIRKEVGGNLVTLEGTPQDWEKVLNKARELKEYKLEWWTSQLEPLLEEFVKASKGTVNQEFWRNMFKCHSPKSCGAPETFDGWIIKFFPYDNEGKRNNLKQIVGRKKLPSEIVKVDLKYIEAYNDTVIETPLELWSGFIGLKQNNESFALRPQIGWMVRKKSTDNTRLINRLKADAKTGGFGGGINLRVKEFPSILLKLEEIKQLELTFINEIDIPDELSKVKIERLELSGKITEEGIQRIKSLFPNTNLKINRKNITEISPGNSQRHKEIIGITYE